jgi:Na+-driven multidrug efflux pump
VTVKSAEASHVRRRELILQGSLGSALLRVGWPVVLTMQLALAAGAATYFWVGRLVGAEGMTILSLLQPVVQAVGMLFAALAGGTASLMAVSVGANDKKGTTIAATGLLLTVGLFVVIGLIVAVFSRPLAVQLGAGAVPTDAMQSYVLCALLVALPGVVVLRALVEATAAAGWTTLGLRQLFGEFVLVMGALPLAISVLGLGTSGVPVAQGMAAIILLVIIGRVVYRERSALWGSTEVDWKEALNPRRWLAIVNIGVPANLTRVGTFVVLAILVRSIAEDSGAAVAGFGIAMTLYIMAGCFTQAVGIAGGIVIGQNCGAKNLSRCTGTLRLVVRTNICIALTCFTLLHFGRPFVALFSSEPAVVNAGAEALRTMKWGLIGCIFAHALLPSYVAIGATKRAALVGITVEVIALIVALSFPFSSKLAAAATAIAISGLGRGLTFSMIYPFVFLKTLRKRVAAS